MTYDKHSFLAGLAVGRQLKGWATADALGDIRKYAGWSADPAYTRVQRGRLAQYDLYGDGFTLETSGLVCALGTGVTLSGNTITMAAGSVYHDFSIRHDNFAAGDIVSLHAVVRSVDRQLKCYTAYRQFPMTAGGVFQANAGNPSVAETAQTGEGTVCDTLPDTGFGGILFWPTDQYGASSASASATVEIDALRVDYACYKQRTGYCVAAFVKYLDGSDSVRLTPCLISGVRHFTLYGSADDGTSQTGTVTSHTLDGMTFYMCSDYLPALAAGRELVGAPLLDFTAGDPITSKDALFAAVADATGLAVYPGTA